MPQLATPLTLVNLPAAPVTGAGTQLAPGDTANFESGTTGIWVATANATISSSTDQAHNGTRSLKSVAVNATGTYFRCNPAGAQIASDMIALSGQIVTVSLWVYNNTGSTLSPGLSTVFANAAGTTVGSSFGSQVSCPHGVWTFFTATATAGATTAVVRPRFNSDVTGTIGDTWYIDDVSVVRAGPAPGDTYYDTTLRQVGVFNGTSWQYVPTAPFARSLMLSLL